MSGFRNVMKEGWHPKGKDGAKESWRGDFKGINQVAGWMGKGSKESDAEKSEHISQPISSLKDPSSFGPPPKHINYHGAAAVPNQTTPDRRGLGAPLSREQIEAQELHRQQQEAAEEEELQKPPPPPVPYRVDTTGLSTNNLPPPPRRLDSASPASTSAVSRPKPPKPPPRLPARNGSTSSDPPPVYSPAPVIGHDYINQDASSRLANAGVSVPGFGIGERGRQSPANAPVNELQSRFSHMNTGSASPSTPPTPLTRTPTTESQPASGGSSIQNFRERHADKIDSGKQKYGDFRERHADTIDSGKQKYGDFRERHADSIDAGKHKLSGYKSRITGSPAPSPPARPESNNSSMNLEPAEPARGSSSVQDFRERHADKIDMGKEKWGGVTSRFNTFVEDRKFSADANKRIPRPPARPGSIAQPSPPASPAEDIQTQAQRKKAPPPPPPKRAEIRAPAVDASAPVPPPIPLGTKPR